MWDQLKRVPPIVLGQSVFNFLDLKSIVKLETALASSRHIQTFRSFLSFLTKGYMEVLIPLENSKLNWLQDHDFPITKTFVHLDKLNAAFETKMIKEIELVNYHTGITNEVFSYLPQSCYEKVVLVHFECEQDENFIEELFSRLYNVRELSVSSRPDGWILSALRGLQRGTNNNILIDKINMIGGYSSKGSVAEIAKCCPRLQSLTVRFSMTEDSLLALSTHCPLLKKLDITCLPQISTEQTAALCAPALFCIHSISTPYIFQDDGSILTPTYVKAIPYLTELHNVSAESSQDHVFIPLITQYCLRLEILTILNSSSTTTAQLLQLVQNCRHLHSVYLFKDSIITDEIVIGLAECCFNLQSLLLCSNNHNAITDASLLALSEHCPHLLELDIDCSTHLTEVVVLQLIQHCKQLHTIKLPMNCLSEDTVFGVPVKMEIDDNDTVTYTIYR